MTDEMFIDRAVGIDLGTTNSSVALLDPSERDIVVYADRYGRQVIPSAVAWDPKEERFLVGRPARNRRGQDPAPIESVKRRMGQQVRLTCGPHELTPEEVSAKILAELGERMHDRLREAAAAGIEVRAGRAVITVPAYFDAPQVEATRTAGELAGLDVIGILQEPTAAAIYHTWKRRLGDGAFLVYDLGGGTFDVSVLRCVGGEYQVLAIDGDNFLGGDDLDRRYAEHIRKGLVERGFALDLDVRGSVEDRERFQQLVHLAQEIKESLSTSEVVNVSRRNVLVDREGEPVDFEAEVGRADYEEVVADLIEKTIECCERALARSHEVAGVGREQIDHVVLVGGSTRVPLVVRRVTEAVCKGSRSEAPLADDVDTCVALGAAVHAAQIGGLRLGRADGRATVSFTTPLVTRSDTLRLGVRVDVAPDGVNGVRVRRDGEVLSAADLVEIPSEVVRLHVPVAGEGENPVTLELTRGDEALVTLPFALYRGDVRPRATGLSQPSVVAKDISIEVLRGGRRDRRVLLSRGTGLPAEVSSRFFTGDQSGAVVLRLLQERLPIKTLMLEVPTDLAVGSPVDLTLRCDETMRMEARARVGQHDLWVSLSAPARDADPTGDVQELLRAAEEVERSLWGSDAHVYRREAEPLITAVREVVATDPAKLAALCARLSLLIDEFRGREAGELSPPMHRFEGTLDDLRRVVYRSSQTLMGMDRKAWEERIAHLDAQGREAWETADAITWRRCYNEAQALLETASQEEFASLRLDDPAYLARYVRRVVLWSNRLERMLSDFVPSASDDVRALQLAERDRLLGALQKGVTGPLAELDPEKIEPGDLRRMLERFQDELGRIEDGFERIPSLGLVTERGSS